MRREGDPLLHLYPQETWHAHAAIVGSHKGLEELRDGINRVLACKDEPGEYGMLTQEISATPADGEYHDLHIHLLAYDHPNWGDLALPYAENQDNREDEDFIMPPCWAWGLTRKLDLVSLPGGKGDYPDDVWDAFLKYHSLPDQEKRDFKQRVEEINSRGGAT